MAGRTSFVLGFKASQSSNCVSLVIVIDNVDDVDDVMVMSSNGRVNGKPNKSRVESRANFSGLLRHRTTFSSTLERHIQPRC